MANKNPADELRDNTALITSFRKYPRVRGAKQMVLLQSTTASRFIPVYGEQSQTPSERGAISQPHPRIRGAKGK